MTTVATPEQENPFAPPSRSSRPPKGWKPPKGAPRGVARMPKGAGRPPRLPVPPRPKREPAPGAAVVATALLSLAGLCLWALLQLFVLGGVAEARSQAGLRDELRLELSAQTAPLGGEIDLGKPVALLEIPTLGLDQVVVEGTASGDTMAGPGHVRSSPLPGQPGVSQILGRSNTYGGPFRTIDTLRPGDGIRVTTGQGAFVYRVDRVRRAGDPLPVPLAAGKSRLTLVTAESDSALSVLRPTGTVYVDATLQGDPVGAPKGRLASVPAAEKPMATDTSGLPLLVLTVQALLVAVVAIGIVRRWVPPRVAWVLGAPVVLVCLWWMSELVFRLLPNIA
ncbi:MAG TPA: class E sortase [Rugosimonospora sp.]|nr:class E sortase [Rugosimonospora sp.]